MAEYTGIDDTDPRARAAPDAAVLYANAVARLAECFRLTHEARSRVWERLRRTNPGVSEDELKVLFVRDQYGEVLAEGVRKALQERRSRRPVEVPPAPNP